MIKVNSSKPLLIRSYRMNQFSNSKKEVGLNALYSVYSKEFQTQLNVCWAQFQAGDLRACSYLGSTTWYKGPLSQSYFQGCLARACDALNSYLSTLERYIKSRVSKSKELRADSALSHQVNSINSQHLWFQEPELWVYYPKTLTITDDFGFLQEVSCSKEVPVSAYARRFIKVLLKKAIKKLGFPEVKYPRLLLDSRTGVLEESKSATHFSHWLKVSTLEKGKRICVPLNMHSFAANAPGILGNSVELLNRDGQWSVVLNKKVEPEALKLAFGTSNKVSDAEIVAFDIGLCTVLASSEGHCLGQNWLNQLSFYDKQITELAAQRQKLKLKTLSRRYKALITKVRGFVQTNIGYVLNRWMRSHPDIKTVVLEDLKFSSPGLSRRMNRIIQNFGLGFVKSKMADLSDMFGFKVVTVNPAYTSQECTHCGWVSPNNRKTQKLFKCELCGSEHHADSHAAVNILERFKKGMSARSSRASVLAQLRLEFLKDLRSKLSSGLVDKKRFTELIAKKNRFLSIHADWVQLAETCVSGLNRSSSLIGGIGGAAAQHQI